MKRVKKINPYQQSVRLNEDWTSRIVIENYPLTWKQRFKILLEHLKLFSMLVIFALSVTIAIHADKLVSLLK